MTGWTDITKNKILDHVLGNTAYTADDPLYLGLSTTVPTDAGGNITEPVGNGYARLSTASTKWNTAAAGAIDNVSKLDFANPTSSWGTIVAFFFADASSGGNVILWGTVVPSIEFVGADFEVSANDMDITQD